MPLSQIARDAFDYCAAHARLSASCDGKRAVFMHWPSLAEACDLSSSEGADLRAMLDALDELHTAGLLSYFDHGPDCYGHTSTVLEPAVAVGVRGAGGVGRAFFTATAWEAMSPCGKVLALHEARRDITKGKPFDIIAECRV